MSNEKDYENKVNNDDDAIDAEIVDDEIVVTDDEENEVERFINFEIED